MGKTKTQIDGQLSFDFSLDKRNYVVQSNSLITGKQNLKINSTKLIRSAIMQIVREDEDFKPYIVSIPEIAKLLGISTSNLYAGIDDICADILKNPVEIREEKDGKTVKFLKMPWVSKCEYDENIGLAIKLNEELKPYLLSLKDHYTQYTLDEIMPMKSVYSIRMYELLHSKIMSTRIPRTGTKVTISVQEIKECCGCENKYDRFSHFNDRVIKDSVKEINEKTLYTVDYKGIKKGRTVEEIEFTVKGINF